MFSTHQVTLHQILHKSPGLHLCEIQNGIDQQSHTTISTGSYVTGVQCLTVFKTHQAYWHLLAHILYTDIPYTFAWAMALFPQILACSY